MDAIAKVIEMDPALAAKVLKTVNSSVYGLKQPCTTIRRALNFLGLSAVKSIVLGFSLVESTRACAGGEGFDVDDHWRRSIYGAAATRVIAARTGACDPDEAFAAALFQDLGALAMYVSLGPAYVRAVAPARGDHALHAEMERGALGYSHAEAGAALAARWRLPDRYVQTIQHHHDPDGADADCVDLVRCVGLGTTTAIALCAPEPAAHLPRLLAAAATWFGLGGEAMAPLFAEIGAAAAELAKLFDKSLAGAADPRTLMLQANEALVNQQIRAMRETEELREKNEALRLQTVTDALTGVGNRQRFQEESARLFGESAAIGRAFALLMLDGDRFKSVNDTHGHHAGDAVLKELARRAAETVGDRGVVCRYGGEEFAVLVPGATLEEAKALGESVRAAIATPHFDLSALPGAPVALPVTVSVGVSCNDPAGAGFFDALPRMIEAADKALYAAKHAGRNRVCAEAAPNKPVALQPTPPAPVAPKAAPSPARRPAGASGAPGMPANARLPMPPRPAPKPAAAAPARPAAPAPGAPSGPVTRVLLLEDDPLSARMIVALLQKAPGVEIEWLRHAAKGAERLREAGADPARRLDAVVSDYTLVGGTAADVLAEYRAQPALAGVPYAVITASEEEALGRDCLAAGATVFMSKDNLVTQLPQWFARAVQGRTARAA
jgi:diguanylate cyclase (GGDEF)-like protein